MLKVNNLHREKPVGGPFWTPPEGLIYGHFAIFGPRTSDPGRAATAAPSEIIAFNV
jgi:hypothetical protein